jgi:hypothetical protein
MLASFLNEDAAERLRALPCGAFFALAGKYVVVFGEKRGQFPRVLFVQVIGAGLLADQRLEVIRRIL